MNQKSAPWEQTGDIPLYMDFLVIGSGVAGLTYALETARHGQTLLLTKKNRADSNSNWAQGGIASVTADDDTAELHAQDTYTAGAGLCNPAAVEVLVHEGPLRVQELIERGAVFTTEIDPEGHAHLALGREGGHTRNRIVFAADRTGWECERTLLAAAEKEPQLFVREHCFVVELAVENNGIAAHRRCVGAIVLNGRTGAMQLVRAGAVLLATGGCGRIYRHTTNPAIATGDGVAMAWRAGAAVANMEFIQFHPTALYHPQGNSFLISEAVRGEGGILRTGDGSTFMEQYHPMGALAPRDIVARAIHAERLKRGEPCVYLDVTHLDADFLRERFPTIYARCLELGIDITKQPIPVVPAAHYACGGVQTDLHGQTTLSGLFAAGEAAHTGVHGANRLASNSLLEAMVYGYRAAQTAAAARSTAESGQHITLLPTGQEKVPTEEVRQERQRLHDLMNDYVGIVRNDRDLNQALDQLTAIETRAECLVRQCLPDPDLFELRNMAQVAQLIVRCALTRKESRGLHYTTDYPQTDDAHWKHDTVLRKEER